MTAPDEADYVDKAEAWDAAVSIPRKVQAELTALRLRAETAELDVEIHKYREGVSQEHMAMISDLFPEADGWFDVVDQAKAMQTRAETAEARLREPPTGLRDWEIWPAARAIYEASADKLGPDFDQIRAWDQMDLFRQAKAALLAFLAERGK